MSERASSGNWNRLSLSLRRSSNVGLSSGKLKASFLRSRPRTFDFIDNLIMTLDLFTRAESAATFILSQTKLRPQIGLVLGSGLGAFADDLTDAVRISYARHPDVSALDGDGTCGTTCRWQVRRRAGGGDAGACASV